MAGWIIKVSTSRNRPWYNKGKQSWRFFIKNLLFTFAFVLTVLGVFGCKGTEFSGDSKGSTKNNPEPEEDQEVSDTVAIPTEPKAQIQEVTIPVKRFCWRIPSLGGPDSTVYDSGGIGVIFESAPKGKTEIAINDRGDALKREIIERGSFTVPIPDGDYYFHFCALKLSKCDSIANVNKVKNGYITNPGRVLIVGGKAQKPKHENTVKYRIAFKNDGKCDEYR